MQGAGGTRTLSHYGPGRDWVRRCVAVCGRPIIGQSARSAKHSGSLSVSEESSMTAKVSMPPALLRWAGNMRGCRTISSSDRMTSVPSGEESIAKVSSVNQGGNRGGTAIGMASAAQSKLSASPPTVSKQECVTVKGTGCFARS